MRKFIDGQGNDSTAAATAYLNAHRSLLQPDLYVLRTSPRFSGNRPANADVSAATLTVVADYSDGYGEQYPNPPGTIPCVPVVSVGRAAGVLPPYIFTGGQIFTSGLTSPGGHGLYRDTWDTANSRWSSDSSGDTLRGPFDTLLSIWMQAYWGAVHGANMTKCPGWYPARFKIFDAYIDITYVNGKSERLRPQNLTPTLQSFTLYNGAWGSCSACTCGTDPGCATPTICTLAPPETCDLVNPTNIIDGDPNSYASLERYWITGIGNEALYQFDAWMPVGPTGLVAEDPTTYDGLTTIGMRRTYLLTDFPAPLEWDYVGGTFQPANISRSEVESTIGLEAGQLEVTWSPKDTDVLAGGKITTLAAFGFGIFDNAEMEIWRACMPKPGDLIGSPPRAAKLGDLNTFGAALMFAGRLGDLEPTTLAVKMTVTDRRDLLNVQVPTNLIEPTNVYAFSSLGVLPAGAPAAFTVEAGSDTGKIYAGFGSPVQALADGVATGGYLLFLTGDLAGFYARIIEQTVSAGLTLFLLAEPLPFAPAPGDTFGAFVGLPLDASGTPYGGFRWVPAPDNSAVVI